MPGVIRREAFGRHHDRRAVLLTLPLGECLRVIIADDFGADLSRRRATVHVRLKPSLQHLVNVCLERGHRYRARYNDDRARAVVQQDACWGACHAYLAPFRLVRLNSS